MLDSLAVAFSVTPFDIGYCLIGIVGAMISYYFLGLRQLYEAAFGALIGFCIYIVFSVLLTQNTTLGTTGGLFPFQFSVFFVSASVYLIFLLAIIFPTYGGLMIDEPENQVLYTIEYIFVALFLYFVLGGVMLYMIEQTYVFRVGSILTSIHDIPYYTDVVRTSHLFQFYMQYRDQIIPLAVVLMVYKLLFSNIITAILLSIWYNISRIGFYKIKNDTQYRVEFHEVKGGSGDAEKHE